MFLLDTNIWLERLLGQERADEVERFFAEISSDEFALTDFSLHSIALALTRADLPDVFVQFVRDALMEGDVQLVRLEPEELEIALDVQARFRLDFDDAYQYVAAERRALNLVSFDGDFDRTERGRTTPAAILAERAE